MHYQRLRRTGNVGESNPRKAPNGTYKINKKYKKNYMKWYRKFHVLKSIGAMHKKRFGGLRRQVLKRDRYCCQICGMTNKQHLITWGREITIDHINGRGRYSDKPDNSMNNLWTLCLSCHGKRDSLRYWLSRGKAQSIDIIEIYKLEGR